MNRRRFLVIATAASAASSASIAPRGVFARVAAVRSVSLQRWPRELLYGEPGRCAGMRGQNGLTLERLLSTR